MQNKALVMSSHHWATPADLLANHSRLAPANARGATHLCVCLFDCDVVVTRRPAEVGEVIAEWDWLAQGWRWRKRRWPVFSLIESAQAIWMLFEDIMKVQTGTLIFISTHITLYTSTIPNPSLPLRTLMLPICDLVSTFIDFSPVHSQSNCLFLIVTG